MGVPHFTASNQTETDLPHVSLVKLFQIGVFPLFAVIGILINGTFLYVLKTVLKGTAYSSTEITFRNLAIFDVLFISTFLTQTAVTAGQKNATGPSFAFCVFCQFGEDVALFSSHLLLTLFARGIAKGSLTHQDKITIGFFILVGAAAAVMLVPFSFLRVGLSNDTGDISLWGEWSGKCSSQSDVISLTLFNSRASLYFICLTVSFVFWSRVVISSFNVDPPSRISMETPIGRLRHKVRKARNRRWERYAAVAFCVAYFVSLLPLNVMIFIISVIVMSGSPFSLDTMSTRRPWMYLCSQTIALACAALRPLLIPLLWKRYREMAERTTIGNTGFGSHHPVSAPLFNTHGNGRVMRPRSPRVRASPRN